MSLSRIFRKVKANSMGTTEHRFQSFITRVRPHRVAVFTLYDELGVLQENAKVAMEVFGIEAGRLALDTPAEAHHSLLFVGHAVDTPNQSVPRFPPSEEPAARQAISHALVELTRDRRADFMGVAGGS